MEKNKYRIVKIIDDTSIVINAGKNNSINIGDEFEILGKNGEKVLDPLTGESLGEIDLIKGTVIARYVYPRMTICSTEAISITSYYSNSILPSFIKEQPLNVDDTQVTGGFFSDEPVQIGDYVLLVDNDGEN